MLARAAARRRRLDRLPACFRNKLTLPLSESPAPLHLLMQLVCVHAGAGYYATRNHDVLKAAMRAACQAAMQQTDGMQACVEAIQSDKQCGRHG